MKKIFATALAVSAVLLLSSNTFISNKQTKNFSADSIYTIYLSFDDGPLEGSEDINDAVKKEDIPINVFVVGLHATANKRMEGFYKLYEGNSYIEIGNHSFTHAYDHYE